MNINTHLRYSFIGILAFFTFFDSKAGDTAKSRFISIDSAIVMGQTHSHRVAMANSELKQVQSTFSDIKNRALPSVVLSAGYTRLSDIPTEYFNFPGFGEIPSTAIFPVILNNYSAMASLQENVFSGFLLKNAIQNMQFEEKSAEFTLESRKNDVSINIIIGYLSLFKVQEAGILVKESLEQIRSHVKEVSDFASHGLATQNDVLRVKLEESNTELSQIDIDNQVQTLNFNMDVMLGLPENTAISLDSTAVLSPKAIQPLPYYLQKSTERNDIKASDMQQKAAEAAIKETQSDLYPKLSIAADYDYLRPNPRIVPPLDQFQPSWDIGFRIAYNLTDLYSNKNKADVSRAKLAEAQANYAELSDNAKMEINQSYLEYQQALQKTGVAEKSLTQAQENYKIVKSRYDNHISLLTDLMDANNYLLNAKINLISSKADAQLAYYKLLKAAGDLNNSKK
jgi:outer membrane protein TolC